MADLFREPRIAGVPIEGGQMADERYFSDEIIALSPRTVDEAKIAADELKAGKPTIINFSELTPEERIWALHFLNGVVYALGGKSRDIGSLVFLFAPPNINVFSSHDD